MIQTKVVKKERYFTEEELRHLARLLSSFVQQKEQLEKEKKSIVSEWKSKIDSVDTQLKEVSNSYSKGYEWKDHLCYIYLNYETNTRHLLSAETGELLGTEPFLPRDYEKQHTIIEEEIENDFVDYKTEGIEILSNMLNAEAHLVLDDQYANHADFLEQNKFRYITVVINEIIKKNPEKFTINDQVDYNTFYDITVEWFVEFKDKIQSQLDNIAGTPTLGSFEEDLKGNLDDFNKAAVEALGLNLDFPQDGSVEPAPKEKKDPANKKKDKGKPVQDGEAENDNQ